jgi:hypothetical protein
MATVTWTTPDQWGMNVLGVWTDVVGALSLVTGDEAGLVIDANTWQTLTFQSGRILEGPIVSTAALTSTATPVAGTSWSLQAGLVPDATPADFSTAALPWARDEVDLGTLELGALVGATVVTITFTTEQMELLRAHVTSRSTWDGKVAISLRNLGDSVTLTPFSVATTQDRFFSGLEGGPYGGKHRFVRDHRFGMPLLNTQLVRDGDERSLWVRADDSDPEDEIADYRPRTGEGSTDDGIPE